MVVSSRSALRQASLRFHSDQFVARQARLYVAILGAGYFVSRGLAKSGSREPDTDDPAHQTDGREPQPSMRRADGSPGPSAQLRFARAIG